MWLCIPKKEKKIIVPEIIKPNGDFTPNIINDVSKLSKAQLIEKEARENNEKIINIELTRFLTEHFTKFKIEFEKDLEYAKKNGKKTVTIRILTNEYDSSKDIKLDILKNKIMDYLLNEYEFLKERITTLEYESFDYKLRLVVVVVLFI